MTSRERVLAALDHRTHDRVPIDVGGTFATGFTARAYERMREFLGISGKPANVFNEMLMLVETEAEIRDRLGVDTIGIGLAGGHFHDWRDWTMPDRTRVRVSNEVEIRPSPDGGWELFQKGKKCAVMPPDGYYFDACEYAKWRDSDPTIYTDELLGSLEARCCAARQTDLAVVLSVPFTIFNGTNTDFLCALYTEKEEVHERVGTWVDHTIEALDRVFQATGDRVDVFAFSGDAGTQRAPLVSPEIYEEMLVPHFRRVTEHLHRKCPAKFFYHTCGSVYRLIPGFLELGIDILNPLQVNAFEMEAERLANEFGKKLVFWGGGIDAQRTLVHGTPQEIRKTVRERLRHFTRNPGYVFAFDHNIQPDVPPENVLAALDAVREWTL